ncbi:hypothetical protein LIER_18974 [Lithospermum erythrorhizon]|uniref:Retrovirus-related Pol polyprotein from transposon TNT 1-94-like beta-barrel domain-containing protein n=1 Tax=Lithospermum erythrorhizon TaxID=34254 RepID=A0AAV3QJ46_LITER
MLPLRQMKVMLKDSLGPNIREGTQHKNAYSPSSESTAPKSAFIATSSAIGDPSWYLDSGASNHFTADLQNLSLHNEYNGSDHITIGNGNSLAIDHIGTSHIPISKSNSLTLNNVLHVPAIKKNLLSVSQLTLNNNVFIEFHASRCFVKNFQGQVLLKGTIDHGLYRFEASASSPYISQSINKSQQFAMVGERTSSDVWHSGLGHPSTAIVDRILNISTVPV